MYVPAGNPGMPPRSAKPPKPPSPAGAPPWALPPGADPGAQGLGKGAVLGAPEAAGALSVLLAVDAAPPTVHFHQCLHLINSCDLFAAYKQRHSIQMKGTGYKRKAQAQLHCWNVKAPQENAYTAVLG